MYTDTGGRRPIDEDWRKEEGNIMRRTSCTQIPGGRRPIDEDWRKEEGNIMRRTSCTQIQGGGGR